MQTESLRTDLHRIAVPSPTLPPATTTNAWVLGARSGIVIDPAAHTAGNQKQLIDTLTPFSPQAIFLTHHHRDHTAAVQSLKKHFGTPVYAHRETAQLLDFEVDRLIEAEERLPVGSDTWKAVHTPGHAPGHLCLLSDHDQSLIAGDMVAGEGTILIQPSEGSIREYINSLRILKALRPSRLLPAHGPVLNDATAVLQMYIEHRHSRILQIWDCLNDTPQSPLQLAKQIYTELPHHFLGMAAIQVHCGLLYLLEDDAVIETSTGWQRRLSKFTLD